MEKYGFVFGFQESFYSYCGVTILFNIKQVVTMYDFVVQNIDSYEKYYQNYYVVLR